MRNDRRVYLQREQRNRRAAFHVVLFRVCSCTGTCTHAQSSSLPFGDLAGTRGYSSCSRGGAQSTEGSWMLFSRMECGTRSSKYFSDRPTTGKYFPDKSFGHSLFFLVPSAKQIAGTRSLKTVQKVIWNGLFLGKKFLGAFSLSLITIYDTRYIEHTPTHHTHETQHATHTLAHSSPRSKTAPARRHAPGNKSPLW